MPRSSSGLTYKRAGLYRGVEGMEDGTGNASGVRNREDMLMTATTAMTTTTPSTRGRPPPPAMLGTTSVRMMSASCIPASSSTPSTHVCPRCAPPPRGSTLSHSPTRTPYQPTSNLSSASLSSSSSSTSENLARVSHTPSPAAFSDSPASPHLATPSSPTNHSSTHVVPDYSSPPPPPAPLPPQSFPPPPPPPPPSPPPQLPQSSHHATAFPYRAFATRPRLLVRRGRRHGNAQPSSSSAMSNALINPVIQSFSPPSSSSSRPTRTRYNATTASARAAAQLAEPSRSGTEPILQEQGRPHVSQTSSTLPQIRPKFTHHYHHHHHHHHHHHNVPQSNPSLASSSTLQPVQTGPDPPLSPESSMPNASCLATDTFPPPLENTSESRSRREEDRPASRRSSRVVVKRRVIRGSSVFRAATEEDIDEFLQLERHREMVACSSAAVDIPPTPAQRVLSADLMSVEDDAWLFPSSTPAKKHVSKRGVRKMSNLLTRHLGLEPESGHADRANASLDLAELAAMDEYKAIGVFLREMRRFRKQTIVSTKDKTDNRFQDKQMRMGMAMPYSRRKDTRNTPYQDKMGRYGRVYSKLVPSVPPKRSWSADDPDAMQSRLHRESRTTRTNNDDNWLDLSTFEPCGDYRDFVDADNVDTDSVSGAYPARRSQSDILMGSDNKVQTHVLDMDVGPASLKRRAGRLKPLEMVGDLPSAYSPPREFSKEFAPSAADSSRTNVNAPPSASSSTGNFGKQTLGNVYVDEDDDAGMDRLRILTSIEPMDPTNCVANFADADPRRGTSYHAVTDTARASRRPGYRSGLALNDSGLLRRLRSFRRKMDDV